MSALGNNALEVTTPIGGQAAPNLDDQAFRRWVSLLEDRTGVVVPPERKPFLVTRLRTRMREIGVKNFNQYYLELADDVRGMMEWATLVDRLTVHETHFFRHAPSFDLIRRQLLPEAVRRNSSREFHAWSVGCSTGEEAYSLGMVIDTHMRALNIQNRFGITATDVSKPALEIGRQGLYAIDKLHEIPQWYQDRYVDVQGKSFEIALRLRKRVAFALMNLMDLASSPLRQLDLIYCQNVLIYFPRERRQSLVSQMVSLLRPGGWLVLGPGEVLTFAHPDLTRIESQRTLAYRHR